MIITICCDKGGVSKTTTSIHLGGCLSTLGYSVVIIDSDKNRSALVWSKEEKLPMKVISHTAATTVTGEYKFRIIDTQARPNDDEYKDLVETSDILIVPTTQGQLDLDAAMKTAEKLNELGGNYSILLTKVEKRLNSYIKAKKFLKQSGLNVFKAEIPKLNCIQEASRLGVLVKDCYDSRADIAWKKYMDFTKEVIER